MMKTDDEGPKIAGMVVLAFILGCWTGFLLIVIGLTAPQNSSPFKIHAVLVLMGALSYLLTIGAPKAWWAIGALIGLAPIGIFFGRMPLWFADAVALAFIAEALALAFGPAALCYWLSKK